jgi:hypothetical protein
MHILDERKKKGQSVEECLSSMARALVSGDPRVEPQGKDNGRPHDTPQIWLADGNHQVVVSPFWHEPGLPTHDVPTWVVSGYQMGPGRRQDHENADPVSIKILNPPPEAK